MERGSSSLLYAFSVECEREIFVNAYRPIEPGEVDLWRSEYSPSGRLNIEASFAVLPRSRTVFHLYRFTIPEEEYVKASEVLNERFSAGDIGMYSIVPYSFLIGCRGAVKRREFH